MLRYMAQGAVEYAKELGYNIPIVLHLDHGDSFDLARAASSPGFSSVMIDGSGLPYDENVRAYEEGRRICPLSKGLRLRRGRARPS